MTSLVSRIKHREDIMYNFTHRKISRISFIVVAAMLSLFISTSDGLADRGVSPGGRLRRSARRRRGVRGFAPAVVSVLALVATAGGLVGSASPASAKPLKATITSVSVAGSSTTPTITIDGAGFGGHLPAVASPSCFLGAPTSGKDYAHNKLGLTDVTGGWYAGNKTDCVTLTNVSYSPTEVTFQLGGFYNTNGWVLNAGDNVTVDVAGATATAAVEFPTITSVSFGGTSVAPTITINGSDFGTVPAITPAGCDDPSGDNDFGDDLYIVDNTKNWNAGDGAACIGLTNVSYTHTQVVFDLGPLYGSYGSTDWVLDPSDNVTVHVAGATFTTTVDYPTTINSVSFSGWSGNPTITINGSDFGPTPPSETAGCDDPSGDNDYYNDDLYIVDNTGNWTAGVPGACVGLTNVSYANTQIAFNLGSLYGSSNWVLHPGDNVTVYVAGASATATVQYPKDPSGSPIINSSWAGYVDTNETYTHVSGSWKVPNASCGFGQIESSATWVGIDGANETIGPEQIGTDSNCAFFGGEYEAWFEMAPNGPAMISNPLTGGDTVSAGDVMNGLVQYAGTNASGDECYDLQIQDQTKGWIFSTTKCIAGALGGTAEWIEEDPSDGLPLTPFGSVTFTNCDAGGGDAAVYGAPIWYHPNTAWIMSNAGGAAAAVSGLSNDGSQFTVTWQHS